MAQGQLAARHQRKTLGPLRRCSRACSRRATAAYPRYGRSALTRRGSLARRRTSLYRRAQVLPLQLAHRHADQATGRRHQSALGLRAGPSATQGRARPRPLRGTVMERPAPTRTDVHDRARLPPVTSAQAGQRGEKESRVRGRSPACQRSDKPSLTDPPDRRTNHARTAGIDLPTLKTKICQSSANLDPGRRLQTGLRLADTGQQTCACPSSNQPSAAPCATSTSPAVKVMAP